VFLNEILSDNPAKTFRSLDEPSRKLIIDNQLIGSYIGVVPLVAALKHDASGVNAFISDLFKYAFETLGTNTEPDKSAGTVHLANLLIVLRNTMIEDHGVKLTAQSLDNFEYVIRRVEEQFWSRFQSFNSVISWLDIVSYYYFSKRLGKPLEYALLREFTQRRLKRQDYASLGRYMHDVMFVGWHTIYHDVELAFEMLSVVLTELPVEHIQAHKEILIEDLIHLRTVNEYRTDIFLDDPIAQKLGDEIRHVVRTSQPRYNIADRLGASFSWFARHMMLDDDPTMRHYMRWFLSLSLVTKDEREWMGRVMGVALEGIFAGKLPDLSSLTADMKLD